MRSYIEYCIHYEEFGQDLDFLDGKYWSCLLYTSDAADE